MQSRKLLVAFLFVLLIIPIQTPLAQDAEADQDVSSRFISVFYLPPNLLDSGFNKISDLWEPSHTPMAIEMLSLSRGEMTVRFNELLKRKTGQDFGADTNRWFVWWWQQEPRVDADYAAFKSKLYGLIDEKFERYFSNSRESRIRLDEIRWGGVLQDGIPPLRQPRMITAAEADYLDDDNIVFGIEINGDARAYPKRILAWHEMFIDEIGGTEYAGVYCTLCGAVILYETVHKDVQHHLGTSGFLYRSNKLMYD
ncbi:MAG: DUF3179 domain-containing (seleno)protein, partial [bacterium]